MIIHDAINQVPYVNVHVNDGSLYNKIKLIVPHKSPQVLIVRVKSFASTIGVGFGSLTLIPAIVVNATEEPLKKNGTGRAIADWPLTHMKPYSERHVATPENVMYLV